MKNKRESKRIRVSLRTRTVAVLSVTLPLVLLGWMLILQIMQEGLRKKVQEDFTFTLILNKETSPTEVDRLVGRLSLTPAVKSVDYISPEMAAEEIREEINEDPLVVLGYNPFYPSLELHLHAEYANRDSLPKIDSLVKNLGGVENFSYRGDLLDDVGHVIGRIAWILLVAVLLMLIVAIIQMSNATHLLIYARRFLIRSMTLLGAPYGQIAAPIVRSTVLNGFWGGFFADVLLAISLWLSHEYLSQMVVRSLELPHLVVIGLGLPLLGMLLSLLTALIATRRYIRMDGTRILLG